MAIQLEVARFVKNEALKLIDSDLLNVAKKHVLDTMACAFAAHNDPIGSMMKSYVNETGESGRATILGTNLTTSYTNAAFVNGILCHGLDYDDSSWKMIGHPSAVVLPAVLSTGEMMGKNGREILNAFIIGTEVSCKLGALGQPDLYGNGWHATSVIGVLGAAAGTGHLLDLSVEELENMLGIAASSAGGLRSNFGSMTKPYHVGMAARNGMTAALLAKQGFTSIGHALNGEMGYYSNFSNKSNINHIENLGKPFDMREPGFFIKPYPSCAATHTIIDAALYLLARHRFSSEEIGAISVGTAPVIKKMLIYDRPEKGYQGKFSLPFVVAVAIADGHVGLETFTDEKVNDVGIKRIMEKIDYYIHDDFKNLGLDDTPAEIEIKLKDGKVLRKRVELPSGSPDIPISMEELKKKFRDCATGILTNDASDEWINRILAMESVENIAHFTNDLKNTVLK